MTVVETSPLADVQTALAAASAATAGAVRLAETPHLAQVGVRADPADADAVAAVAEIVGVMPPIVPNTWARGAADVLWLGPDEWLVVAAPGAQGRLEAALGAIASVCAVDVSDQRTALDLCGPAARELLSAGCALDLDPRALPSGRCAQTLVAAAPTIVVARNEDELRLLVRSSFAGHLARHLIDATAGLAGP